MAAKKCGKKLRAVGQAAERRLTEIGRKAGEGIGKGWNTRAPTRQTRATAKETSDGINGATGSPKMKQTREHAKQERVRKVVSVGKGIKVNKDATDNFGRLEKSETRACTRFERPVSRRSGLISAETNRAEDFEIKENCLLSVADWQWTELQETALLESLSTIKPGVNFWRFIAEQVPGRSAEDCFKKFYSGRTTTRAAKRSHAVEVSSAPAEGNGTKWVRSLRSNTLMNIKVPGREIKATGRGATGPANQESKQSGMGRNAGAITRQTIARTQGAKRRRVDGASNSPDIELKKDTMLEIFQETKLVKLRQRATRGSKKRTGEQDSMKKPQIGASTPGVRLATGFDRSTVSDGDKEIESISGCGVSVDDDDWTKVQEAALQDAYSTIRPSANFWHLISRRVPGRSAEECFNKFYAGHPTPPRVSQRSCLREVDCPPTVPNPPKAKTTGNRQLEAHRTVRNILRRQQVNDENYKADGFAAFEPPDVVHSVMEKARDDESATFYETDMKFCVYFPRPGITENSTTQCSRSDKENWMPKAVGKIRDFGINPSQVSSPEILKKVKDPLMMDKYIDHLHQRRTRRPGTKSAQKNAAKGASGLYNLVKDGMDFREVRLDAIHRAKQELRDVFLRPGSAVGEPFLDLVDDSTDGKEDDEEEDESVDSQIFL